MFRYKGMLAVKGMDTKYLFQARPIMSRTRSPLLSCCLGLYQSRPEFIIWFHDSLPCTGRSHDLQRWLCGGVHMEEGGDERVPLRLYRPQPRQGLLGEEVHGVQGALRKQVYSWRKGSGLAFKEVNFQMTILSGCVYMYVL